MIDKDLLERIEEKKKKLDSMRPLDSYRLSLLKKSLEVEYVYNSTSMEGNSLTLDETKMVLEEGVTIRGKPLREHLDVINQKDAMEMLEKWVKDGKKKVSEGDILKLHEMTLKGISEDWKGRYKTVQDRILGSRVRRTPPYLVKEEMKKLIDKMNRNPESLHAVELSALAHQILAKIHPFLDGNGRCSRLLSNLLLMRDGYPPNTILNKERKKYFETIEKAHLGRPEGFMNFFARSVERMLNLYISAFIPTTRENEMLPLSALSEEVGHSQEYLSLLARRGKISAIKMDGVWHSSLESISEYKKSRKRRVKPF